MYLTGHEGEYKQIYNRHVGFLKTSSGISRKQWVLKLKTEI